MKTKLFILAITAATFTITSCNQDGCTDPAAINYDADAKDDVGSCTYPGVTLHFHSKMGTADFAYDTEVTNWEGRKMKFTTAQVYLSNFFFHNDEGMTMIDDSYILAKPGTMMYNLGEVPSAHYHGFGFSVGVDTVANHADPASWPTNHALSSNNPDHAFWSWNSGYIFIMVEGVMDSTAAMNGPANAPFIYHIGTDNLRKDLMFTDHQEVDGDVTMHVEFDFLELFNGIDLRTDPDSHTMNNMPAAMTLSNNVPNAVTLE
jgi:hypothetical protein